MPADSDTSLVRLRRLNASRAGTSADTIPADWPILVHGLLAARNSFGPIPAADPIAILAVASATAQRHTPPTGPEAGYQAVATKLGAVDDLRSLYRVAFEAVHDARIRLRADPTVTGWLYAAERALDVAMTRPAGPSPTAATLAGWSHALARVPADVSTRAAFAAAYRSILREARATVAATTFSDPDLAESIEQHLTQVQAAFTDLSVAPSGRMPTQTREGRLLGLFATDLRLARTEPAETRMAAFLESNFGQVELVARALDRPHAIRPAHGLELIALAWVAGQFDVRPLVHDDSPPVALAAARPVSRAPAPATVTPLQASPAVVQEDLTEVDCAALARDRDRGLSAATVLAGQSDDVALFGPDEDLEMAVEAGRVATARLVVSMAPNVEHLARKAREAYRDDVRADLYIRVLQAAQTYDPAKGPWHTHAQRWIRHVSTIYDPAGVEVTSRARTVFATQTALHGELHREPTSQEIANRAGFRASTVDRTRLAESSSLEERALDRGPIERSAEDIFFAQYDQGNLDRAMAEIGRDQALALQARSEGLTYPQIAEQTDSSPSTVRRRILEGLDQLRAILPDLPAPERPAYDLPDGPADDRAVPER